MNNFLSTIGEIIKYGGSTFAALAVMSLYTTTDGIFIGNFVGNDGLEAMALILPVTIIFMALSTLFEVGGSAVVAEKIGAGKKNLAEEIMRTNYLCAAIIGIFLAIIGNIFIESIFSVIYSVPNPHEQHIIELAISFLRITLCGLPFLIIIYSTGAFMRCIEQPVHVFYLIGATALANIILDALFIIVFGWGMRGAALATVIAQILGVIIAFWYFKYSKYRLKTSQGFANVKYIVQEFKIGAGFAVSTLMMCVIEYSVNAVLLYYDAAQLLAAVTIANIILTFVYLPLNGLDTGIQPIISKLFASNEKIQCMVVMRYGFFLTMILTFAMYAMLMIYTAELAKFFSNEPITEEMITFLRLMYILQPFVGLYTWFSGIMASLEDEWRNLITSLLPLVVQLPLIWLLPQFLPIEFVAFSYSIQDMADALVAFLLIRGFLKSKGLSLKKIFS